MVDLCDRFISAHETMTENQQDNSDYPIPVIKSIEQDCQALKAAYDTCFNKWFSEKFLKGDTDDSECKTLQKEYQSCVKKAIQKNKIDLWYPEENILGTDKEKQIPVDVPKEKKNS